MGDLIQHYLKKNFISEYKEYLKNPNGECPYDDIDAAGTKDVKYYNDLAGFLTKCLEDSSYKFMKPEKSKRPFAIEFQDENLPAGHIYLTSDQFGFSAPYGNAGKDTKCKKSSSWNGRKNYPYARYLSVNRDDDKGAGDSKKIEFVARCIYETRTIGGSFIWPKVEIGGRFKSMYNIRRGERSYIRDRVDITLNEIRCFYDVYSKLGEKNFENFTRDFESNYPKIILFNSQGGGEKKAIYRWLSIFETFERYVEKLKFEDFVIKKNGKYLIRNMANKDPSSVLDIDKSHFDENIAKIKNIRDMNEDELEILLENVKECTKSRSEKIHKFVNEGGERGNFAEW